MSEPDVSSLLTVAQAIEILDAADVRPRAERKRLSESLGRRLAQDIVADRDSPSFDKSLMDGFAVRCGDVLRAPAELKVVGEIAAGRSAARALDSGEAIAIMTGAPLAEGADGVVPVEETQRNGVFVRVTSVPASGRFIARRGSDCSAGTVVLPRGTKLGPAQIAAAAIVGAAEVEVFAAPRVAVLATGDEIVPADREPGPAQIRNGNSPMLVSLLQRLGCEAHDYGIINDDFEVIRSQIPAALNGAGSWPEHDVLFVTGGMSMGEYDYVPKALLSLGMDLRITKLRIKPGKPFVFGVDRNSKFVFGLPGNPVSAFVCTLRLAWRLLDRMAGGSARENWIRATLDSPLPANGPREFYQPANHHDGAVTPLQWKGSADVFTLAKANALIVRAENEAALGAGARVRLLEIPS